MIKDYSNVPADKRIVNDTENDVTFNIRDKWVMVPVTIPAKDTLSVTATTSEDLAILHAQCEELNLPLEVEGPDITDIVVNLTPDIREGEENSKAQAIIATLSLSGGTEPAVYTIEGPDAEKFTIEDNIVKAAEDLTEGTYSLTFSVVDIYDETYTETDEITVLPAYPEITDVTTQVTESIREGETNAQTNSVIATLGAEGGTQPYTFSLAETDDYAKFKIEGTQLKANENLTEGTYNVTIVCTDSVAKTFEKALEVTVLEAYPEITTLDVEVTPDLRAGKPNTDVGATVGMITVEGGTEPIELTLTGANQANFEIQDKEIKVKDMALAQGTYNITVVATDTNSKVKEKAVQLDVAEAFAEITSIKVTKTQDLREGEANVQADSVVATLSTVGGTEPFVYSLSGTDAESFKVDGDKIKVNTTPLVEKTYEITITVIDKNLETLNAPTTIEVQAAYPEITTFTISPEVGLIEGNENVQADAVVATLSTDGGTADYVYSFKEDAENGKDNAKFKIDGTNVKVNTTPLETGDYKIAMTVTDAHNKTKDQNATISVAAPEVTELNADITPDLQEGNPNVDAGATIATLSTVGGIAPYTYELNVDEVNGANNDSFVIAGDKLNVGETPLTEGTYKVSVKVTDKNDKTATKNLDISVIASA